MLDIIDAVVDSTAIMINFAAFSAALPLSARGRITLAAGVGAWVGLATYAGAEGALAFAPEQPFRWSACFSRCPWPPPRRFGFHLRGFAMRCWRFRCRCSLA